jgi:hypothetical protein
MKQERLELLIEVLENIKPTPQLGFDMCAWLGVWAGKVHACKTTACALGYAALDPRFQAMGLKLVDNRSVGHPRQDSSVFRTVEEYNAALKEHGPTLITMVVFEDQNGFEAGALLFDISDPAACYLFDPDYYEGNGHDITPEQVIERVRVVIDNDGEMSEDDAGIMS